MQHVSHIARTELGFDKFDYHSLRHPYVKPTTKKYSFFLVPMIQLS